MSAGYDPSPVRIGAFRRAYFNALGKPGFLKHVAIAMHRVLFSSAALAVFYNFGQLLRFQHGSRPKEAFEAS
jgi:hypothetical protein